MSKMPGLSTSVRSEQVPLLRSQSRPDGGSLRAQGFPWIGTRFPPATLLIPIAIATRLSGQLPSTTLLQILQRLVCRLWYELNDPESLPVNGRIPDALCANSAIEQNYAAAITVLEIVEGTGSMVGCSAASLFASRYGRRPTLLAVFSLAIAGYALLIASIFVPARTEAAVLTVSVILQSLSSSLVTIFIVNTYVVDVVSVGERTAALSAISGWCALGGALSYTLGGLITTRSDEPILVYIVAAAMLAVSCLYVFTVLPESFPEEKRDELRRQRLAQSAASSSHPHRYMVSLALIFEPLKQLIPGWKPDGGRSWRLAYCAVHVLITQIGSRYAPVAIVLYYTAKYAYTPAQTGYILTTLFLSSMFTLTIVIPSLVRYIQPYYIQSRSTTFSSEEPNDDTDSKTPETSEHLELHITSASWVIAALAVIFAGAATTLPWQLFAAVCVGLSTAHTPVFRSVVAASVAPLKQGEALAAVEMVSSVGAVLSPLIMGTVLTATITTFPQLVFYVHAVRACSMFSAHCVPLNLLPTYEC
ncbi:MFS general substrate transporter [Leucogyrophana mollusca]|uniref:MFS general substrate transporter n=1 Tax=Leucogyrophana mollusca TaxID=85980 RepID=A0ACB8BI68_9AGAM|nr:MFS general substrate transporter [Leucogyrophana mollusca]